MGNPTLILAVLAGLLLLGMVLEELFRRTRIPDVLLLLIVGLAGAAAGLIDVKALQGVDRVFTTAALVLILFEGAVRLRLKDLAAVVGGATLLTVTSFIASVVAIGAVGWAFFGLSLMPAVLLGTIIAGTSSAVVIPMVQALPLRKSTRTVLTLESALSDVLCIVFALAIVGALAAGAVDAGTIARDLVIGFFGALVVGAAAGVGWAVGLRSLRRKRASLVLVAAAVFLVYAFSEMLGLFGAISVLAFGITLGNAERIFQGRSYAAELGLAEGELIFLSEVAFLLKVFFFVFLGASLELKGWQPLLFGTIACVALFAVRPLMVRISTRAASTPRSDAIVASVLIPKGLAAAVLAAVPVQAGLADGPLIRNITFGVILLSIVASSALTYFASRSFVANAYAPLFRAYPETVDEPRNPRPPAPEVAAASASPALPADPGAPREVPSAASES